MSRKKKVYFKGYYGNRNLGDDVFVIVADWICNNLWKDVQPLFFGNDIPHVSQIALKHKRKKSLLGKIQELYICLKASNIIFLGGSVFTGYTFNKRGAQYFINKLSFLNKKVGTIGTSIGPFGTEEDYRFTEEFLSKFKFIAVRDYKSQKYALDMGIENKTSFCFDPAILINKLLPSTNEIKEKKNNKLRIGVSLCHYERYVGGEISKEEQREKAVLDFLLKMTENPHEIEELVFFVFNGDSKIGDQEITDEFNKHLSNRVKTRVVKYSSDTKGMVKHLSECDYIFGMRLHSGILAYSLNIPFTLVEYHPKCTDFLNAINYDQNYRFSIRNGSGNSDIFNSIFKKKAINGLINPDYFSGIMIKELQRIKKLL